MNRLPKGEPLNVQVFYDLGPRTAVKSALNRLVSKGELTNPTRGYYVRPKHIKSANCWVSTGAENLARHWAKDNGYTLTETAFEAAYRVGFQTQAPVRTQFWTSGPSRTFRIGSETVKVLRRGKRMVLSPDTTEGCFYRATLQCPSHGVDDAHLRNAFKRLSHHHATKNLIIEILKLPVNKAWRSRLECFNQN